MIRSLSSAFSLATSLGGAGGSGDQATLKKLDISSMLSLYMNLDILRINEDRCLDSSSIPEAETVVGSQQERGKRRKRR